MRWRLLGLNAHHREDMKSATKKTAGSAASALHSRMMSSVHRSCMLARVSRISCFHRCRKSSSCRHWDRAAVCGPDRHRSCPASLLLCHILKRNEAVAVDSAFQHCNFHSCVDPRVEGVFSYFCITVHTPCKDWALTVKNNTNDPFRIV